MRGLCGPVRTMPPRAPMRTHFWGLVDEALIGQTVTLCGWAAVARDLGGLCFIDLRDHEGIVQVVAEPGDAEGNAAVVATTARVRYEDCLRSEERRVGKECVGRRRCRWSPGH